MQIRNQLSPVAGPPVSLAKVADGVDRTLIGGIDIDDVEPFGEVGRILVVEHVFHDRQGGGLIVGEDAVGEVWRIVEEWKVHLSRIPQATSAFVPALDLDRGAPRD